MGLGIFIYKVGPEPIVTPVTDLFSAIYRGYPCHSIYTDLLGAHLVQLINVD